MAISIVPIRTEADYESALAVIAKNMDAEPGSETADAVDVLVTLVKDYEDRHYPISAADPVEAIKAHMDMMGLVQADLSSLFGSRSRASEVLNRRRGLTMEQANTLHEQWNIPAESLIQPYQIAQRET